MGKKIELGAKSSLVGSGNAIACICIMDDRRGLLSLTALAAVLLVMGSGVSGEKKLSHPALTRGAALTMKVLYW